ncbi:hypothetical protein PACTADRAFT_33003 [Pachysolen tannophilus NRRL Y-2460]|uniref:Sld7 C-terminal domain-containing protein n=1 Tax=Pachysolen tannophilus NRRL Y-2460 TaxID=669874 RepID=A0A1E4TVN5_PACTA|nr:hypothetical protein PACTADRAFT_33003 [Pachysolen tannophilus NRRL Y-2460]
MSGYEYVSSVSLVNGSGLGLLSGFDNVDDVQLFKDKSTVSIKSINSLSKFFQSISIFQIESFIEISSIPIYFVLSKPFDVFTENEKTLDFFKKIVKLSDIDNNNKRYYGKIGLLSKCITTIEKIDNENFNKEKNFEILNDEIDKNDFYLLFMVRYHENKIKIQALPLYLTNFLKKKLKNIKKNHHQQQPLDSCIFIENDINIKIIDPLDKFLEKKKKKAVLTTTSTSSAKSLDDSFESIQKQQKQNNQIESKNKSFNLKKIDLPSFKKNLQNIILSELRLRGITNNNIDYKDLFYNTYKCTLFSFRKKLQTNQDIQIEQIQDTVEKLLNIFE